MIVKTLDGFINNKKFGFSFSRQARRKIIFFQIYTWTCLGRFLWLLFSFQITSKSTEKATKERKIFPRHFNKKLKVTLKTTKKTKQLNLLAFDILASDDFHAFTINLLRDALILKDETSCVRWTQHHKDEIFSPKILFHSLQGKFEKLILLFRCFRLFCCSRELGKVFAFEEIKIEFSLYFDVLFYFWFYEDWLGLRSNAGFDEGDVREAMTSPTRPSIKFLSFFS